MIKRLFFGFLRLAICTAIITVFVIGARFLIARKKARLAAAPKYDAGPMPVHVVAAKQGQLVDKRDYLAVVQPIRSADISARLTAAIKKIYVDEGDIVKTRDILVTLDDKEIHDDIAVVQAQIEQARADLAANEATVVSLAKSFDYWGREARRDMSLAKKGDIPISQAEGTADKANEFQGKLAASKSKSTAVEHLIDSLKKKKSQLKTVLGYCVIRSPYDGLVTRRVVDPGDMASPGKLLFVVEDRSSLKLAFDVPQQDLPQIREGLDVTFAADDGIRKAKLSHLYPSLVERMLRAEVFLPGKEGDGLNCGAYVSTSAILRKVDGLTLIPAICVVECHTGKPHVFVVRKGRLARPMVQVIGSSGDFVAVKGIEPGERVVSSTFLGWVRLASGRKVEVIE